MMMKTKEETFKAINKIMSKNSKQTAALLNRMSRSNTEINKIVRDLEEKRKVTDEQINRRFTI